MVFFFEITNICQKSRDFLFADLFLEIFNIHGGIDFPMDIWSFWICFISVLFEVMINLKFYKRCFTKELSSISGLDSV